MKIISCLLAASLLFLSGCSVNVRPYVQGGISWYDANLAKPEVSLDSESDTLGHVEAGVDIDGISVYARHTSSIEICEQGGGINEIGVYKRIYLDDLK